MKLKTLLATAVVSGLAALATPASASASDPGACAFNGRYIFGSAEYQCSLWRGNVPVYSGYSTSSSVAGYLYRGGRANWFLSQCVGNPARLSGFTNYWWEYTMADNGRWGYVPLVYFAGGANNQGSGVLPLTGGYTRLCGGGQTHPS